MTDEDQAAAEALATVVGFGFGRMRRLGITEAEVLDQVNACLEGVRFFDGGIGRGA